MEVVIVLSVSVLTELIVTPPPVRGGGAEYCDKRVCLFVREHISGTACPTFTNFFVHMSFGPPLAALRYVMYFRFYG